MCLLCWVYCAPVTSRVSARQPSYFFLLRQKKVTKKKASHVRAASRSLALLAAFGTLANSLRSNSASVLIRTLLRCSARPNGGGIPLGSSASRTSPERLVRFAHLAGVGVASFLTPHFSQGHGTPCHYTSTPSFLTPHFSSRATTRVAPTTSLLRPHSSLLTPHSSLLTPHSSPLTPHSSLLTPHSSLLTPHPSLLTPHSSPLRSGRSKRERLAEYGNLHHPSQVKLVCIKEPQHGIGPVNGFGPFGGSGAVGWVQQVLLALLQKGF